MYAGQIVEQGTVRDLFSSPLHPYTQGLMNSVPRMNGPSGKDFYLKAIPGVVPPLYNLPAACRFQDRCAEVFAVCRERAPELAEVVPGHDCRCWRYGKE
jgi:peptide/nickel transport system ATP-binding protein